VGKTMPSSVLPGNRRTPMAHPIPSRKPHRGSAAIRASGAAYEMVQKKSIAAEPRSLQGPRRALQRSNRGRLD
jgi:hypothetical protein